MVWGLVLLLDGMGCVCSLTALVLALSAAEDVVKAAVNFEFSDESEVAENEKLRRQNQTPPIRPIPSQATANPKRPIRKCCLCSLLHI